MIEDTWANPTMADIGTEMTDSLSRSGKGGMLGAFLNADGSESAPGITWTNDIASGWYRAGAGDFRYSVQGQDLFRLANGTAYRWVTNQWEELATSAGSSVWGSISGTLSNQTDLNLALNAKLEAVDWGDIGGSLANQADLVSALATKLELIVQDTSPALGNDLDIGGFGLASAFTTAAGNAFNAGDVGIVDNAGNVVLAQANAEATIKGELVMAMEGILASTSGSFMEWGRVTGLAGLVSASTYYISAVTAGLITNIQPTGSGELVRVVGYTRGTGASLTFKPGDTWIKLS